MLSPRYVVTETQPVHITLDLGGLVPQTQLIRFGNVQRLLLEEDDPNQPGCHISHHNQMTLLELTQRFLEYFLTYKLRVRLTGIQSLRRGAISGLDVSSCVLSIPVVTMVLFNQLHHRTLC